MNKNKLEVLSHSWTNKDGSKSRADCYPFVNGTPCAKIASCSFCKFNNNDADYCDRWIDDKDNAPLFCGPICYEFSPNKEAEDIIN